MQGLTAGTLDVLSDAVPSRFVAAAAALDA